MLVPVSPHTHRQWAMGIAPILIIINLTLLMRHLTGRDVLQNQIRTPYNSKRSPGQNSLISIRRICQIAKSCDLRPGNLGLPAKASGISRLCSK